jgi:hypothetical protein
MYVAVYLLLGVVASHVAERYVDMHPAVFVIVLVLLSQFGFLWCWSRRQWHRARDLFRYVYA